MTSRILEVDRAFLAERTAPLLADLAGGRVFVTGGTGFVGSWILEALCAANDGAGLGLRATVLTRDPEGFARRAPHLAGHALFDLRRGDVRTFSLREEHYDAVVHAAFDSSRPVDPAQTREIIAGGTARCLELARRSWARRFLFVSSGAVYGRQPEEIANAAEDSLGRPGAEQTRTEYGTAKLEAEEAALRAGGEGGFGVKIARGFAFVGPRLPLDAHFAIGNFLGDALAGRPIRVRGDGSAVRSYLYAPDLAVWLLAILLRGAPGAAYNVGSEHAVTVADLARLVADVVAPGLSVEIAGASAGGQPDRYVPDTRRARAELGLAETVGLAEAIARTAAWHRKALSAPVH